MTTKPCIGKEVQKSARQQKKMHAASITRSVVYSVLRHTATASRKVLQTVLDTSSTR